MASNVNAKAAMNFPAPAAAEAARAPAPKQQAPATSKPAAGKSFSDELAKTDKPAAKPAPAAKPVDADQAQAAKSDAPAKDAQADAANGGDAQAKAASKREQLKPLKDAATSNKQGIAATPVVAFLTGKLDQLEPASIPGLVSENDFLMTAMGQQDLSTFLSKPFCIGDLIDSLDLPDQVALDAEKLGLDLTQMISPTEFLRSIGVDPQRVFAELKLLKDNIATGTLATYMQRATGGVGAAGARDVAIPDERFDVRTSGMPAVKPSTSVTGASLPTGGAISVPVAPAQSAAPTLNASPKAVSRPSFDAIPTIGSLTEDLAEGGEVAPETLNLLAQAGFSLPQSMTTRPADILARSEDASPAVAGLDEVLAEVDPAALAQAPADATQAAVPAGALAPSMHKATFDAWHDMGQRLQASGVNVEQKVDPRTVGDLSLTGLSLEDQLLARQTAPAASAPTLAGVVPTVAAPTTPNSLAQVQVAAQTAGRGRELTIDPRLFNEARAQDARVEDVGFVPHAKTAMAASTLFGKAGFGKADALRLPVEELRLAAPALGGTLPSGVASSRGEQRDFSGEREDARDFGEGRAFEGLGEHLSSMSHVGPAHKGDASFGSALAATDPGAMTPEQRANLMQSVIDRAAVLVKDGGGTVRLDLGSAELGHLELAIKMQDDRVDLRVMTASDRVREVMMGELNRLRDALQVQNVQLGNVDVGVGGRQQQAFAGFAGGTPFERRQMQEQFSGGGDRRSNRDIPGIDAIRDLKRPVLPHVAAQASFVNTNGRLAIRA